MVFNAEGTTFPLRFLESIACGGELNAYGRSGTCPVTLEGIPREEYLLREFPVREHKIQAEFP